MRFQLKNQRDTRRRLEFVTNVSWPCQGEDPAPENKNPRKAHASPWQDCGDVLMRIIYVPEGINRT